MCSHLTTCDRLSSFFIEWMFFQMNKNVIQYVAVLQLRHLLFTVLGSLRAPPQQTKLLFDIIKIFGRSHEASQNYSSIFFKATTLPTSLNIIWEKDLNLLFNGLE